MKLLHEKIGGAVMKLLLYVLILSMPLLIKAKL